jgi:hypothetical protein
MAASRAGPRSRLGLACGAVRPGRLAAASAARNQPQRRAVVRREPQVVPAGRQRHEPRASSSALALAIVAWPALPPPRIQRCQGGQARPGISLTRGRGLGGFTPPIPPPDDGSERGPGPGRGPAGTAADTITAQECLHVQVSAPCRPQRLLAREFTRGRPCSHGHGFGQNDAMLVRRGSSRLT